MTTLHISLLGPLQVTVDGNPITHFQTDAVQVLLAWLAVQQGEMLRRDEVAGVLAPDRDNRLALKNMRNMLVRLRDVLGDREVEPPFLLIDRKAVGLSEGAHVWVDSAEITHHHNHIQSHPHDQLAHCPDCLDRLEKIAALYRGDMLAGLHFPSDIWDEWLLAQRAHFRQLTLWALAALTEARALRGEWALAQAAAQQQLRHEPWLESAHLEVMQALAMQGDRRAALAQFQQCKTLLWEELGVEPATETSAFAARLQTDETPKPTAHPLPPTPTPLIGRAAELGLIADKLKADRLLTIIGVGGAGKTRLAIDGAARWVGPVAFVDLTLAATPGQVDLVFAAALDLTLSGRTAPRDELIAHLESRDLLLLCDNAEHLLADGDSLTELLSAILAGCPDVRLLVTSRLPLNLAQEVRLPLDGLAWPDEAALPTQPLANYPALQLLRARIGGGDSAENLPHLRRICQLVDGLPLALEMVAGWGALLSWPEVVAELERGLDLLSSERRDLPPRQRSMRAVFEQSWVRLASEDQALLAKLSVFAGKFEREAALAVTDCSLLRLLRLCERSLLRRVVVGDETWFELHPLVRQFSAEKLTSPPLEATSHQTNQAHADHYASLLKAQEQHLNTPAMAATFSAIARRSANINRAWAWLIAHDGVEQLTGALQTLHHYWIAGGHFVAASDLLTQALAQLREDCVGLRVRLLTLLGQCELGMGRHVISAEHLEQSLVLNRLVEDSDSLLLAHQLLGTVRKRQGRAADALAQYRFALSVAETMDDPVNVGNAQLSLGGGLVNQADWADAEPLLLSARSIFETAGYTWGLTYVSDLLGQLYFFMSDLVKAESHLREAVELAATHNFVQAQAGAAIWLGRVLQADSRFDEAIQLQRGSVALFESVDDRHGVADAQQRLGVTLQAAGYEVEGATLLQQSLSAALSLNAVPLILRVLYHLDDRLLVRALIYVHISAETELIRAITAQPDFDHIKTWLTRNDPPPFHLLFEAAQSHCRDATGGIEPNK